MPVDVTNTIIAGVTLIVQAVSVVYGSRTGNKRKRLCARLVQLRDTLITIKEVGAEIGNLLRTSTFYQDSNRSEVRRLIRLVEAQQENLAQAQKHFEFFEKTFEIAMPELQSIYIHVRGKSDRINIIYSIARRAELDPWLRGGIESWERSILLDNPRKLISILKNGANRVDRTDFSDTDFRELVKAIDPLTEFIKSNCRFDELT